MILAFLSLFLYIMILNLYGVKQFDPAEVRSWIRHYSSLKCLKFQERGVCSNQSPVDSCIFFSGKMLPRALLSKIRKPSTVSLFQFNQQACYYGFTITIPFFLCFNIVPYLGWKFCRENCTAGIRKPWSSLQKAGML